MPFKNICTFKGWNWKPWKFYPHWWSFHGFVWI